MISLQETLKTKVHVVILAAIPEEIDYLQNYFSQYQYENVQAAGLTFKVHVDGHTRILLMLTGVGTAFAASVMTLVYAYFQPDYFFFTGTAGAIKADLKVRDVIIVEKAFEAEIQGLFKIVKGTPWESCLLFPLRNEDFPAMYSADPDLLAIAKNIDFSDSGVHYGTGVTSNAFPTPPEFFEKLKAQAPVAIDMETSAFYQIAWALNAKALAVRGISNILNHDGTDDKIQESDVKGGSEAAAKVLLKILTQLSVTNEI